MFVSGYNLLRHEITLKYITSIICSFVLFISNTCMYYGVGLVESVESLPEIPQTQDRTSSTDRALIFV